MGFLCGIAQDLVDPKSPKNTIGCVKTCSRLSLLKKCFGLCLSFSARAMLLFFFIWRSATDMLRSMLRSRYKFKHAGAPKFDFPLHCWWCEGEHFIKSDMVQVWLFFFTNRLVRWL